MKKGKVHSKDKHRTYIEVHHSHLKEHKDLFPGKKKTKIVPAKKRKYHNNLKKGDRVEFDIQKHNNLVQSFLFHSIPIISIIIGILIGIFLIRNETGTILITILFMFLGLTLKDIIHKKANIFREINVHIAKPAVKVVRAKKRKRRKK